MCVLHSSLSGPDMFIEACLVQLTRSFAFEHLLLTSGDSTRYSARPLCCHAAPFLMSLFQITLLDSDCFSFQIILGEDQVF